MSQDCLIVSETNDMTTNVVLSWLVNSSSKIKRLNTEGFSNFSLSIKNEKGCEILLENKKPRKIWHRRQRLNFVGQYSSSNFNIYNYIKKESDAVVKASEMFLKEQTDYVGSWIKETENYKPYQLEIACKVGLKVPNTLITNSKEELLKFYKKYKRIITKDIRYPVNINLKDQKLVSTGAFLVSNKMINHLNEKFAPMIFQEYIEKLYEIRVFFFKDDYYAMAIFSQNNEKTKIDFRNYDEEKPNRFVPVKLPIEILKKLKRFSKEYKLNTGSIDLIKSTRGNYIFLEVNPQGQLDWLSKNCNYYIEKRIANFFINE